MPKTLALLGLPWTGLSSFGQRGSAGRLTTLYRKVAVRSWQPWLWALATVWAAAFSAGAQPLSAARPRPRIDPGGPMAGAASKAAMSAQAHADRNPDSRGRRSSSAARDLATVGTVVMAEGRRHDERLLGDYEAANILLLVWQPEWESAVKRLAAAAAEEMEVQILVPRGAWRESRPLRRWARRHCVAVSFQRYDTAWIRDYGPLQIVQRGEVTWRDFGYDRERPDDDALPIVLAESFGVPIEMSGDRLDGGGLVNNGRGLCVMSDATLEEAILEGPRGRTPGAFVAELGCEALAIIDALPDEQTGHADVSVQFLADDLVAVAKMDWRLAPVQAQLLDGAAETIRRAARKLGQPLRVVRVPMLHHGDIFFSYVNAVRGGRTLFVPSYRNVPDKFEQQAHSVFRAAMPGVRVLPIPASAIVEYGGALHCITLGLTVPRASHTASATCRRHKLVRKRVKASRRRRRARRPVAVPAPLANRG